ncbi:MAG: PIN domain-containing protein [Actinobacteria bacterium]|nr:PIN domain-containing protein [Cyanobacteriota bacterium]MCL5772512.1 PIN domain-containing protein [Actinomycetota bacterium]
MFLFDTDAITNLFKKIPSKTLIENISKLDKSEQYISSITVGEIAYGAFKSKNKEFHLNNLKNILLSSVNILDFDVSAAFIYGRIRSELGQNGNIISNTDIQIASIAISNNLTLITGNIRHFQQIKDLKIENWLI